MANSKLIKGSIDLMKIKKEHIFEGKNGAKYVNVDIWVSNEADQYGNDVAIKQSFKVGENFESVYIGNAKKKFGFDSNTSIPAATPPLPKEEKEVLPF